MQSPRTAFDPERTEATDEVYAAIGRLLTLATRFETHCRRLAMMTGILEDSDVLNVAIAAGDDLDVLLKKLAGGALSLRFSAENFFEHRN